MLMIPMQAMKMTALLQAKATRATKKKMALMKAMMTLMKTNSIAIERRTNLAEFE
jgi:hypothetical protein